ncbi:MAG: tRNA (N6-isopentenyl adenosine(37)-C2)-methylthiotransferase MiaB [Planctomycetes bacterium]|nr:tRNA (N6-isopentenyl adenosine(37)-C2)-methylthiotransferase MiaB [Planctomycetota bacterium]
MSATLPQSRSDARSFHLRVFGCQMNFYDGELMRASLLGRGYQESADPDQADVVLFHTCSVREGAEERVHGLLGELRRAKRERPDLVIGVIGCMADREGKELFDREPHVDIVCGSRHFPQLDSFIDRVLGGEERVCELGEAHSAVDAPVRDLSGRPAHWSAHVAVMRGCDLNCTYCIVPSVRGRVESRPLVEIVDEVKRLVDQGVTEVHLLGQTVDSYGRDLPSDERPSLARLLDELAPIDELLRLRMITLHPSYVDAELADAMARSPQFMRFLPIPLQAGSDRVLKAMKRGYNTSLYRKRVDLLRERMPDLELISDWIVGFPGETDEDYLESERMLREIGFLQSYVFQYSPRPGTRAYEIEDNVPTEVKKERNNRLLALQRKLAYAKSPHEVGKRTRTMLEQGAKRHPGHWAGRTHTGHPVVVPDQDGYDAGMQLEIELVEHDGRSLIGRALGAPRQGKELTRVASIPPAAAAAAPAASAHDAATPAPSEFQV